jgi:DNA-binding MarR family transcriptional regulator
MASAPQNVGALIDLFFKTNRSLHKHMHQARIISHFSFLQFFTMKIVEEEGPISMKDLARMLSITPASTTTLVDGLVRIKALERSINGSDRRVILLRTTAEGRKKLNDTDARAKKELKKIFLELSESDRERLHEIMDKLSRILTPETRRVRGARNSEGSP